MDVALIVQLITAAGLGGVLTAVLEYFKDRKKRVSDTKKTDTETTLLSLNTVIEQLNKENQRLVSENNRLQEENDEKEERNRTQRRRILELEEEIDSVRQLARDTQHRCDHLAHRLQELVNDAQENN